MGNVKMYTTRMNEDHIPYVKEVGKYHVDGRRKYNTPEALIEFVTNTLELRECPEEYLYIIALDTAYHIRGLSEISHGTASYSAVSPREVMQRALLMGANSIVIVHNHPSGEACPSDADIKATRSIKNCAKLLDIPLCDHIIIGDECYSMAEHGDI